jgi:nicotinamide-nucleotide amidase
MRGTGANVPPADAAVSARVAALIKALRARGETLAVAESLTGGLLAATIVDVPGASRVFRGGLIVYATDLKATLAGVPAELLVARGPVDPDVAIGLARGARERCQADWGVATTGVAGPEPQGRAAVGTVFVAASGPAHPAEVRAKALTGSRWEIRAAAVTAALDLLAEVLGVIDGGG